MVWCPLSNRRCCLMGSTTWKRHRRSQSRWAQCAFYLSLLVLQYKGMFQYADAEAVCQVEAMKVARSGKQQRSMCASVKNGTNCKSCLFCPFSAAEDVALVVFMCPAFTCMPGGVTVGNSGLCNCCVLCLLSTINSLCLWFQPQRNFAWTLSCSPFLPQKLQSDKQIFSQHRVELSCCLAAPSCIAITLRVQIHTCIATVSIFTTSACHRYHLGRGGQNHGYLCSVVVQL